MEIHQNGASLILAIRQEHSQRQYKSTTKMINAVLVFNNNGQARLTKFYTQIVSPPLPT